MTALLVFALAVGCFAFNVAHYAVGAKLSLAEKALAPMRSAKWAGLADAVQWADYILFAGLALQDGVVYAVLVCAVPSIAGAMVGEYYSVKSDWVSERVKKAKKAAERAKAQPDDLARVEAARAQLEMEAGE